ncbi:MAG TPA: VOC family protein [Chloroflexota bacterium]|nr:VOC family protein [Chloroflexota bacterium]
MKFVQAIPALPVHNIDESVAFYRDKLGFTPGYQAAGFARLYRGGIEIQLWEASDETWKTRGHEDQPRCVESGAESFLAGTASCRVEVEGIDELFEEFQASGVLYDEDTKVEPQWWGDRSFPVLDLHRNLITFFERGASPDSVPEA